MNTLKDLYNYCKEQTFLNPNLKEDIADLFELACDEVDEGGSLTHEIANCIQSIEELKEQ